MKKLNATRLSSLLAFQLHKLAGWPYVANDKLLGQHYAVGRNKDKELETYPTRPQRIKIGVTIQYL
jgi:hypothetical protein